MSRQRIGVYPGTFDPITLGHMDIIRRGAKLVDRLVIGVTTNIAKSPMFSDEERLEMVRRECADMAALCDHPAGTLLAIEREFTDDGISERVRMIPASGDGQHARIWGVDEAE